MLMQHHVTADRFGPFLATRLLCYRMASNNSLENILVDQIIGLGMLEPWPHDMAEERLPRPDLAVRGIHLTTLTIVACLQQLSV